jgi:hypothetical protein
MITLSSTDNNNDTPSSLGKIVDWDYVVLKTLEKEGTHSEDGCVNEVKIGDNIQRFWPRLVKANSTKDSNWRDIVKKTLKSLHRSKRIVKKSKYQWKLA